MSPQARDLYANQQFAPPGSPRGTTYGNMGAAGGAGGGQAAPAPAPAPQDTSYQNALDLLSSPGKVTTPGANVPVTKPVSMQPSVLDQFLAGQHGGQGAGGYSNTGFFDTLNRLKGTPT